MDGSGFGRQSAVEAGVAVDRLVAILRSTYTSRVGEVREGCEVEMRVTVRNGSACLPIQLC